MIVRLSTSTAPTIIDCNRVDRLHATADGPIHAVQLEPLCRQCDDQHVWVSVEALRAACTHEAGDVAFDEMLAYAERSGWLDPQGDYVRAHVATSDDD